MPRNFISPTRKALYYSGMALSAIGALSFLSVFVSVIFSEMRGFLMPADEHTFTLRGFGGMMLMMIGFSLMAVGSAGVAGSGLVLDPKRARKDLEPWSRMKGGMLKDALDEAGIDLSRGISINNGNNASAGSRTAEASDPTHRGGSPASLPFDEQLRRLHALYVDGIISEAEYETKKRQILENS